MKWTGWFPHPQILDLQFRITHGLAPVIRMTYFLLSVGWSGGYDLILLLLMEPKRKANSTAAVGWQTLKKKKRGKKSTGVFSFSLSFSLKNLEVSISNRQWVGDRNGNKRETELMREEIVFQEAYEQDYGKKEQQFSRTHSLVKRACRMWVMKLYFIARLN